MPPGFNFPYDDTDVWVPSEAFGEIRDNGDRTSHNYEVLARVRAGATVESATEELNRLTVSLKQQYGEGMDAIGTIVTPLKDQLTAGVRQPLFILMGAAGFVLLVACTNLASGLLARAPTREQEIAIRTALGASRGRVVRQLLVESVLLSSAGALLGTGLGIAGISLIGLTVPGQIPVTGPIRIDGTLLGFAVLAVLVTTALFGLLPAVKLASKNFTRRTVSGNSRTSTSRRPAWKGLVIAEIALAQILLIGSGLLIRSFWGLVNVDPGFAHEQVSVAEVSLPTTKYSEDALVAGYYREVIERVQALPGVEGVGMTASLPLSGGFTMTGGFNLESTPGQPTSAYRVASPGYFEAMGIPILAGRTFQSQDLDGSQTVAVINQALAQRVWPGSDPIGQRVRNLRNDSFIYGEDAWLTIVGVVGDARYQSLERPDIGTIYVNVDQRAFRATSGALVVKTVLRPEQILQDLRSAVQEQDGDVPVSVSTLSSSLRVVSLIHLEMAYPWLGLRFRVLRMRISRVPFMRSIEIPSPIFVASLVGSHCNNRVNLGAREGRNNRRHQRGQSKDCRNQCVG